MERKQASTAAGQYLGYSLQTTRAAIHLLDGPPDAFVSVEVFGDVGVDRLHGGKLAEEAKSALAHNPVADRAVDFWKTFANWTDAVRRGDLDVQSTRFVLYVTPPPRVGTIAKSFSSATHMDAARAVLASAKKALWGYPPRYKLRKKVAESLAPHLNSFFSAPEDVCAEIISRFVLTKGNRDSIAEVENRIAAGFVSLDHVPLVTDRALGWVKSRIDRLIQDGKPAVLSVDEFRTEMAAFVRKVDRSVILNSFAPTPPREAVEAELPQRQYIKQLELIGADDGQKLRAANDYLRAAYDRSEWAAKGIVHRTSIEEFEQQLVRLWESKRKLSALEMEGRTEEHVGMHVFASCADVSVELQGLKPPGHFAPGCYHSLSDAALVGWHPRYIALLQAQVAPAQ